MVELDAPEDAVFILASRLGDGWEPDLATPQIQVGFSWGGGKEEGESALAQELRRQGFSDEATVAKLARDSNWKEVSPLLVDAGTLGTLGALSDYGLYRELGEPWRFDGVMLIDASCDARGFLDWTATVDTPTAQYGPWHADELMQLAEWLRGGRGGPHTRQPCPAEMWQKRCGELLTAGIVTPEQLAQIPLSEPACSEVQQRTIAASVNDFNKGVAALLEHELEEWSFASRLSPSDFMGGHYLSGQDGSPQEHWSNADRMLAPLVAVARLADDMSAFDVPGAGRPSYRRVSASGEVSTAWFDGRSVPELDEALMRSAVSCMNDPKAAVALVDVHKLELSSMYRNVSGGRLGVGDDLATCMNYYMRQGEAASKAPGAEARPRTPEDRKSHPFTITLGDSPGATAVLDARSCLAATVDVIEAVQRPATSGEGRTTEFRDAAGRQSLETTLSAMSYASRAGLGTRFTPREATSWKAAFDDLSGRLDQVEDRWGLRAAAPAECMQPAMKVVRSLRDGLAAGRVALDFAAGTFDEDTAAATLWLGVDNPMISRLGIETYDEQVAAGLVCAAVLRNGTAGCDAARHETWTAGWCAEVYGVAHDRFGPEATASAAEHTCRRFVSFSGGSGPFEQYTGYVLNGRQIVITDEDCVSEMTAWCK